ncbi:predicted protein [Uncinocarpus reesii 1704]|uniref:RlpA-like protein double-psi beta-barrel domain-containing protein n=1 Tax=Uncinocarpus reesii (strain UAMH 1704) TaxID=336963 RepID=C4JIS5_UNCRE|nr:uncharacterized protein UREG_02936 [Uncinocarpus reesii 1704]EEP78087.1 predicted protein [Uncinocarpus reesii 1704]
MLFARACVFVLSACAGVTLAAPAPEPEALSELKARDMQGRGTVYQQLGAFGSCGQKHGDGDMIVAISNSFMKSRHNSPYCRKSIRARNKSNGKTVVVRVADTCMGCGPNDLDFSVGAWNRLTGNAPWGTFPVSWNWA